MISYNEILSVFKRFSDGHRFRPRFLSSEFLEQFQNEATEDIVFPVIFIEPVAGDTLVNVDVTEVNVFCVDRLRKDRKNTNDVVSDTKQILSQDLTRWLEEGQQDIEIERTYPCTPVNNYLLDYTAGWSMRVRIHNERISICEVPFDGVEPEPPTCDPATVENTEGTELGQAPSGGVFVVDDSTLTVNSQTFDDLPATVDKDIIVEDDQGSTVGTVQDGKIIVPAGSETPLGAKPLQTGQTISYRTGDNPTRGRSAGFLTLPKNNPFGNLNRFTATDGTQNYSNGVVLDWTTDDGSEVLAYELSFTRTGNINWDTAIDSCVALVLDGKTGWELWNDQEAYRIFNPGSTSNLFNYPPWNNNLALAIWTATTRGDNTAQASVIREAQNIKIGSATKSTNGGRSKAVRYYTYAELGL